MKKIVIMILSLLLLFLVPQCASAEEVHKSENLPNLTKKIYYFNFKNIPPIKYILGLAIIRFLTFM